MSIHIITDDQADRMRQEIAELKRQIRQIEEIDRVIEQVCTREGTRPA